MKKLLFSLLIQIFTFTSLMANQQGHFFLDMENENIQVSNVVSVLSSRYELPANSSFVLFRDETDNLGIRHLSYQYYIGGIEVEHAVALVHAKGNKVFAVNGDIIGSSAKLQTPTKIAPLKAAQKVRKNAKETDAKLKIIRAIINGTEELRYAYVVMAEDFSSISYVDAETGEIIKTVSLVYHADVTGTATTMYNGTQAITCYEQDGTYYLMDDTRGIYTLDATNNAYKINYQQVETNDDAIKELTNLIKGCSSVYNSSTTWNANWNFILSTITINSILHNSTWYIAGEGEADVYIKIKNQAGTLLYTSGYYTNPEMPVTFNVSSLDLSLSSMPYSVELWDYDPVGDDDIIDIFTIEVAAGDMMSIAWQGVGNYSDGCYTAVGKGFLPHLDAHWGMEKTLDFYKERLNRNSFDNKGSVVFNLVNPPMDEILLKDLPLNAFAVYSLNPYPMIYGTGLTSTNEKYADLCVKPMVSIDIMAHEFTHIVTSQNGNGGLEYSGESGALNESFSDILGIAVKNYATGKNDWLIGSGGVVNASNLRSMCNPNNSFDGRKSVIGGPQPDTYKDNLYWMNTLDTDKDKGGIHTNSGVQNYWFYLLSEGGFGKNEVNFVYDVKGIGIDKAIQIAYRNLIYYLTPEATFEDSRYGSIQAAIDLYGKNSQEHKSVIDAWNAVGVYESHDITIFAKMPSNWGNPISAWVWENGVEGSWVSLEKNDEWYSYTANTTLLNIVFVNGTTWNGDNNQSVDITLAESSCIQLFENTSGKRNYEIVECEEPEIENYVVLAQRNAASNWFYMTSDLGTASTKRYQAVDAGTTNLKEVNTENLESKYYWQLEENKLHTAAGYSTWKSGNSANLDGVGKELSIEQQDDEKYIFSFMDGEETRRLALNKAAGNDYFAYYKGTDQIYKLTLLKEGENGSATSIESIFQNESSVATKILRDGQILIIRGDKTYTVTGQEVK